MGKILSVDFGTKNIGLAVSDELGISAAAISPIKNEGEKRVIEAIINKADELNIESFLFGTPLFPDGADTKLSTAIRNIAQKIGERSGKKVMFLDEYLTSKNAEAQSKKNIDSNSARLLLIDYLNSPEYAGKGN